MEEKSKFFGNPENSLAGVFCFDLFFVCTNFKKQFYITEA